MMESKPLIVDVVRGTRPFHRIPDLWDPDIFLLTSEPKSEQMVCVERGRTFIFTELIHHRIACTMEHTARCCRCR